MPAVAPSSNYLGRRYLLVVVLMKQQLEVPKTLGLVALKMRPVQQTRQVQEALMKLAQVVPMKLAQVVPKKLGLAALKMLLVR